MNKGNNFRERKREFKFKSQQPRRGILERERERERERESQPSEELGKKKIVSCRNFCHKSSSNIYQAMNGGKKCGDYTSDSQLNFFVIFCMTSKLR